MQEFHEFSMNEFKGQKRNERHEVLKNQVLDEYIKKKGFQKKIANRKEKYRTTEEYRNKLNELLLSDTVYRKYCGQETTPELEEELRMYNQERLKTYLKKREKREKENRKKQASGYASWKPKNMTANQHECSGRMRYSRLPEGPGGWGSSRKDFSLQQQEKAIFAAV